MKLCNNLVLINASVKQLVKTTFNTAKTHI